MDSGEEMKGFLQGFFLKKKKFKFWSNTDLQSNIEWFNGLSSMPSTQQDHKIGYICKGHGYGIEDAI